MINLIPASAKKSLIQEYWLRVVSVWFLLWATTLLVGVFILVPSYVLLDSQVSAYKDSAESASEKIANYKKVSDELTRSGKLAATMKENFALGYVSDYVTLFRNLEHSGITISEIGIERTDKDISPIRISGVATNRQALAAFRDRALEEEQITAVDLPISNLTKDKDIPFEITATIGNQTKP